MIDPAIEQEARRRYTAGAPTGPAWGELGDGTKNVWRMELAYMAGKEIEVRIRKRWLDDYSKRQPVHEGILILKRLKEAGMPIRGVLGPVMPETGTLTLELDDLAGDDNTAEYVYTWRP